MEKKIKGLLYELGIPVIQRDIQESPTYTVIHYDLVDIKQLLQVEKKIKFLSAYLHIDIFYRTSSKSHFALAIPNNNKKSVNFFDKDYNYIFNKKFSNPRDVFAGVDEENVPQVINLDTIPHILVAGTTGSGKSVAVNGIICSILRNGKHLPQETKPQFYMIDTKRVELSHYRDLDKNCKIATDVEDCVELLEKACAIIDARYKLMEKYQEKTIPSYINRVFVVIEELGDLMISTKKAVEKYIVRIAQLGRACGVHLIVATQRPTVDVVTGAIKANIGCRFALQTTSAIDSRNIIGKSGAELLQGEGDCLLKLPNNPHEVHLKCPYISDKDIVKCIKQFVGE
jgi:S-DNA-T family DNA segregation ATPase FtsK/SpoIIIE